MFAETARGRKSEFLLTCEKRGRGARATPATSTPATSTPAALDTSNLSIFELRARWLLFFSLHVA